MSSFNWRLEKLERQEDYHNLLPTEIRIITHHPVGTIETHITPCGPEEIAKAERLKAENPDETFKLDWIPASVWDGDH